MNIVSVANPQWIDADTILMSVVFIETGITPLPFTASRNDITPHGRSLFARALAGEFGVIAAGVVKPLAEVKAAKLATLAAAREAVCTADVTVGANTFPAAKAFQDQVSHLLNQSGRGKPLPTGDVMRTAIGQPITMTPVLLGQIEDTITAQNSAAWTKYWSKFDQVNAAADAAAVEAIVW